MWVLRYYVYVEDVYIRYIKKQPMKPNTFLISLAEDGVRWTSTGSTMWDDDLVTGYCSNVTGSICDICDDIWHDGFLIAKPCITWPGC